MLLTVLTSGLRALDMLGRTETRVVGPDTGPGFNSSEFGLRAVSLDAVRSFLQFNGARRREGDIIHGHTWGSPWNNDHG